MGRNWVFDRVLPGPGSIRRAGLQNYGLHKLLILLFSHATKKNYEDMIFQFIFKTLFLDYDKFYLKKKQTTNK